MALFAVAAAGAAIGGGIGAAVGGYAAMGMSIGWAIGSLVGQMLFPPKGPTTEGPRLRDTAVQSSADGAPIPKVYGTIRTAGNVFWATDIIETPHEEEIEAGGKGGGPSATSITYTYSVSLAIGICEGPITGIRRIWADSKLMYSVAEGADPATFQVNVDRGTIRIYTGTETQTADPLIAATEGAAVTPAYRGLAYVVFEGLQLADFANHIPNIEFEVVSAGSQTWPMNIVETPLEETPDELVAHLAVDTRSLWSYWIEDVLNAGDHIWRWDMTSNAAQRWVVVSSGMISTIGEARCIVVDTDRNELLVFGGTSLGGGLKYARYDLATGAEIKFASKLLTGYGPNGTLADSLDTRSTWFYCPKTQSFWTTGDGYNYGGTYAISFIPATESYAVYYISASSIIGATTLNRQPLIDANGDVWTVGAAAMGRLSISPLRFTLPDGAVTNQCFIWNARGEIWIPRSTGHGTSGWMVFNITSQTFTNSIDLGLGSWTVNYTFGIEDEEGNVWFSGAGASGTQYIKVSLRNTAGTELRANGDIFTSSVTVYSLRYTPGVLILDGDGVCYSLYVYALAKTGWDLADVVEDICEDANIPLASVNASSLVGQTVRGYIRAKPMSARAAIEPLGLAYGFDAVESDDKLKFVMRGGASVATILENELGTTESDPGDAPTDLVVETRALETELPASLTLGFFNVATDYEIASARARRLISRAEQNVYLELPVVFSSEEGIRISDRLMHQAWLERTRYEFALGLDRVALEPTDVVTLPNGTRVRLTKTTLDANDVLRCEAVGDDSGALISYAVGTTNERGETVLLGTGGFTFGTPLDLPLLLDSHSELGIYLASAGEKTGWRGAMWYQSNDGGSTWAQLLPLTSPAKIGSVMSGALSTRAESDLWDFTSTLTVKLVDSTLTLSAPASLNTFYNGANAAAVGNEIDGWEIIQFYTVTSNADGTYTLRDFLRARRGTGWAIAEGFGKGATFVLLESPQVGRSAMPLTLNGADVQFKPVTIGQNIADAPVKTIAFAANSVRPLSPVAIGGAKLATNTFNVHWSRRARLLSEWNNSVDVPLDETAERYVVGVWDENFVTQVRSIVTTASSVTYTNSQATADFGAPPIAIGVRVQQYSDRVGYGYAGEAVIGRALEGNPGVFTLTTDTSSIDNNGFRAHGFGGIAWSWTCPPTEGRFNEGKVYFEALVNSQDNQRAYIGFTSRTGTPAGGIDLQYDFMKTTDTGSWNWGSGDIVMCAIDCGNCKVFFGKNGTWPSSANPVTGEYPMATYTNSPGTYFRPAITAWAPNGATYNVSLRLGTGHSYAPPAGYVPYNY